MAIMLRLLAAAVLAGMLAPQAMSKTPVAADRASERAAIKALRAANNRAIAARDLDGVMQIVADDYVAVGGSDGILRNKDDMRKLWAEDFASAHPRNQCVRRPTTVQVAQVGGVMRTAESGRWSCLAETPSGEATLSGAYFAHWSKRSGAWRVVSDNYVTLGCHGRAC